MAGNRPASHSSEAPARDPLTRRLTPRRSKMHGVMQASPLAARTVRVPTSAASLGKISSRERLLERGRMRIEASFRDGRVPKPGAPEDARAPTRGDRRTGSSLNNRGCHS